MKKFSYTVLLSPTDPATPASEILESYRSFMSSSISAAAAELQKLKTDVIQKNGTILRGGLTQFLSTPLKSDKDEIIKLIEDSIENSVAQLNAAPMLGTVEHSLWSIVDPQDVPLHRTSIGVVKRLLKEGKSMLTEAGCSFGKSAPPVFVSRFHFDGFSTILPLQKSIDKFEDRQQLEQVNNVVHTVTASTDGPTSLMKLMLIDLHLEDISAIEPLLPEIRKVCESAGVTGFGASVQTFHSRIGSLFQLCCSIDVDTVPIGSVITAIGEVHPQLKTALNNNGSVVILNPLT